MTTKQMELLSQYFAGEQLELVATAIYLMRSSEEDLVDFNLGVYVLKSNNLFTQFIEMLHDYYKDYIIDICCLNTGVNLPQYLLTSEPPIKYVEFLLHFSFFTSIYNIMDNKATALVLSISEDWWEFEISFKGQQQIMLPLFLKNLEYVSVYANNITCNIVNYNHVDYPVLSWDAIVKTIDYPNTLVALDIPINYLFEDAVNPPYGIQTLWLREVYDLDVLAGELLQYHQLKVIRLNISKIYYTQKIVFPPSLEEIDFNDYYGVRDWEFLIVRFLLDNEMHLLPKLRKINVEGINRYPNLQNALEGFIWNSGGFYERDENYTPN